MNDKIIVGSRALEYSLFHLPRNEGKGKRDVDIWVKESYSGDLTGTDHHIIPDHIMDMIECVDGYASKDMIYTIKLSHFCWDIFWEKTKDDIVYLSNYCRVDKELFHELKKHWQKEHGNKDFLSLKRSKDDFFNDHVTYYYDHDYLHELVAYPNPPTYTRCLKDGEDVLIDKERFDNMNFDDKIKMFREEITAIALERWIIPEFKRGVKNRRSWYSAYMLSLKKTIISLTKNWANEFIIENLSHFTCPDYSMFEYALVKLDMEYDITYVSGWDKIEFFRQLPYNEVLLILSTPSDNWHKYVENELSHYVYINILKGILSEHGWEVVTQECGQEGGSEYVRSIFRFNGVLYKTEYSSSDVDYSFDGIEYTVSRVKEKMKLETYYE